MHPSHSPGGWPAWVAGFAAGCLRFVTNLADCTPPSGRELRNKESTAGRFFAGPLIASDFASRGASFLGNAAVIRPLALLPFCYGFRSAQKRAAKRGAQGRGVAGPRPLSTGNNAAPDHRRARMITRNGAAARPCPVERAKRRYRRVEWRTNARCIRSEHARHRDDASRLSGRADTVVV